MRSWVSLICRERGAVNAREEIRASKCEIILLVRGCW